jgi:hypothetical protein
MTASGHEMPMEGQRMIIFKQEKTTIGKGRTFGQGKKKMDSERVLIFRKETIERGREKVKQ